jgi:hypothetical protein
MSAVTILIPIIAAAAARREGLLDRLRTANAVAPDKAVSLAFEDAADVSTLAELLGTGEVKRAPDDAYWLDEPRVASLGASQGRTAVKLGLAMLGVALAGLGAALIANR